jgi:hypothetical protein
LRGGADDPRIVADAHSRQPAADEQALTQLRERLEGAQADLERAKADNNSVEQDHCREEIDVVKTQLKLLTGIGGKPRDLNNRTDKLRPSIHASLKRAYEKLRMARPPMNDLASHFKASTSAEADAFVYRPVGPAPAWSFEPSAK